VIKRYDDGTPFIRIKNEHLLPERKGQWSGILKAAMLFSPWLVFTVVWNFNWPEATPVDDVFFATCFYFFNRSFINRFN